MGSGKSIWTIGHSTQSLEHFIMLLRQYGIELVADIRSFPGSRKFPQFNRENLMQELPRAGIAYEWLQLLGGRRKVKPDSTNTEWRHPAFRGYADYMETERFKEGIAMLTTESSKKRTAIMCSEVLWWRCHRSMVSDYLKSMGWKVWHIMGDGKVEEHPYTAAAHIVDGVLSYRSLL